MNCLHRRPPPQDKYRVIDLYTVSTHQGKWIKIQMKNGSKREGKVMDVRDNLIQLEQRFSAGYFSIQVPLGQIEEIQLLILNGRAGAKE